MEVHAISKGKGIHFRTVSGDRCLHLSALGYIQSKQLIGSDGPPFAGFPSWGFSSTQTC